jgi:hypothetical protein|tara:strand:- start:2284 stop:2466 length:183 start_codon:yes stop_codon:yes gene_type:complete
MDMSINSRRYQIHLLKAENRAKEESYEEQRKSSGSGGGNRTRSISGDELKAKLKSGEING